MSQMGSLADILAISRHVRFGSKADMTPEIAMSAIPPKADIAERNWDVRFGP